LPGSAAQGQRNLFLRHDRKNGSCISEFTDARQRYLFRSQVPE